MALVQFEPFPNLDRLFEGMWPTTGRGRGPIGMPMDVYRRGDEYVVEIDLPGVDPSEVDVSVDRNVLSVSAERPSTHADADEQIVCERPHAQFRRQLYLGDTIDTEGLQATYEAGVLCIRLPLSKQAQPRRIQIAASPTGDGGQTVETSSRPTGG